MRNAKRQREDPQAAFNRSPAELLVGQTLHLFDASSDPSGIGIAWRAWDFGDDETATGSYPTHRYAAAGDYTVKLTLATFDGRLATASQAINVTPRGAAETPR
jgi:PKD repeat protein